MYYGFSKGFRFSKDCYGFTKDLLLIYKRFAMDLLRICYGFQKDLLLIDGGFIKDLLWIC